MAKKMVIIDDNFAFRELIKSSIDEEFEFYSSADGVEGLGIIFAVDPDVIVVDSTLPQYAGKEVIDFLRENKSTKNKLILLHYGDIEIELAEGSIAMNKEDRELMKKISSYVSNNDQKTSKGIVDIAFSFALTRDKLMIPEKKHYFFVVPVMKAYWVFNEIFVRLTIMILELSVGTKEDVYIDKNQLQIKGFRSKDYPVG